MYNLPAQSAMRCFQVDQDLLGSPFLRTGDIDIETDLAIGKSAGVGMDFDLNIGNVPAAPGKVTVPFVPVTSMRQQSPPSMLIRVNSISISASPFRFSSEPGASMVKSMIGMELEAGMTLPLAPNREVKWK